MKRKHIILILVVVISSTIIISGSAKKELSVDKVIEAFSYTWVNPNYSPMMDAQKLVVKPDGFLDEYANVDASLDTPALTMRYTINEAWIDRERNIWFKATFNTMLGTVYSINKLSNTGTEWEYIWSYGDLPDQIDADAPKYRIYYRQ